MSYSATKDALCATPPEGSLDRIRSDVLSVLAIRDPSVMFAKVSDDFNARLIECNGEGDHVHLLVEYPPQVSISRLVNSLKGVSSRRCVRGAQKSVGVTSRACCGRPHTSPPPGRLLAASWPPHAVVRRSPSFVNTWINNERTSLLPGLRRGIRRGRH
jgi:hypothetical protein